MEIPPHHSSVGPPGSLSATQICPEPPQNTWLRDAVTRISHNLGSDSRQLCADPGCAPWQRRCCTVGALCWMDKQQRGAASKFSCPCSVPVSRRRCRDVGGVGEIIHTGKLPLPSNKAATAHPSPGGEGTGSQRMGTQRMGSQRMGTPALHPSELRSPTQPHAAPHAPCVAEAGCARCVPAHGVCLAVQCVRLRRRGCQPDTRCP